MNSAQKLHEKLDYFFKTWVEYSKNLKLKLELLEELVCTLTEHIAKYGVNPGDDCPPEDFEFDEDEMKT